MAIDSAEKRQNLMGVGRPWMRAVFPIATPDAEWRVSVGNAFGGNGIAAPGGVVVELLSIRHVRNFNRDLSGGFR